MNNHDSNTIDPTAEKPIPEPTPAASSNGAPPETGAGTSAPRKDYSLYRFIHTPEPRLEDCLDSFWSAGVPLENLPPMPPLPDEPHEILKRLGPSPFAGSSFPLIGFFASAYERVSRFARERTQT
ncbi:MAG: hypothetical protein ACYSUI_02645 [Planctomycetota bacterium]|jgi:hypothetical protein